MRFPCRVVPLSMNPETILDRTGTAHEFDDVCRLREGLTDHADLTQYPLQDRASGEDGGGINRPGQESADGAREQQGEGDPFGSLESERIGSGVPH